MTEYRKATPMEVEELQREIGLSLKRKLDKAEKVIEAARSSLFQLICDCSAEDICLRCNLFDALAEYDAQPSADGGEK